jgi:hypothetical protein
MTSGDYLENRFPPTTMKQSTLADLPILERCLLLLLATCGLLDMAGLVSGVVQWKRLHATGFVSEETIAAGNALYAFVAGLQVIFVLVTAVVWIFWLYRAYRRLQQIGSNTTDYTPGFAVGSWFIPFLNLVRPYQVIRELWLRSQTQNEGSYVETDDAPVMLRVWWGIWLLDGILSRVQASMLSRSVTRYSSGESVIDTSLLQSANIAGLAQDLCGLLAAILAIIIVYRIAGFQSGWRSAPDQAIIPDHSHLRTDYLS